MEADPTNPEHWEILRESLSKQKDEITEGEGSENVPTFSPVVIDTNIEVLEKYTAVYAPGSIADGIHVTTQEILEEAAKTYPAKLLNSQIIVEGLKLFGYKIELYTLGGKAQFVWCFKGRNTNL